MRSILFYILIFGYVRLTAALALPQDDASCPGPPQAANIKLDAKPGNIKLDAKPDIKVDVKPDIKVDVKPDVKPDLKPDNKPDNKPEHTPDGPPSVAASLDDFTGSLTDNSDPSSSSSSARIYARFVNNCLSPMLIRSSSSEPETVSVDDRGGNFTGDVTGIDGSVFSISADSTGDIISNTNGRGMLELEFITTKGGISFSLGAPSQSPVSNSKVMFKSDDPKCGSITWPMGSPTHSEADVLTCGLASFQLTLCDTYVGDGEYPSARRRS